MDEHEKAEEQVEDLAVDELDAEEVKGGSLNVRPGGDGIWVPQGSPVKNNDPNQLGG
jgi:hypothetical protein